MKLSLPVFLIILLSFSAAWGEVPQKEKMLIKYILQNEFRQERDSIWYSRKDLHERLSNRTFGDDLKGISKSDDPELQKASILNLGGEGKAGYNTVKAREALKKALKSEHDNWMKLEMARVLASLDDAEGKDVLVLAFKGKENYKTSSGIEIRKAMLALLVLNYDFPDGFPKQWFPVLGGLRDYLVTISIESHKPKE